MAQQGTALQQSQQERQGRSRGQVGARQAQAPPEQGMGMEPITVEDLVETDVVTVERDTPLSEVVEKMADEDVGSVIVVEDDSPVDVLTDRTIALSLASSPDASDRVADDLIDDDLVTGTTEMTVFDAVELLSDEGFRRLPIVDEDGTLEGIVTLDDILVLLGTELANATEIIKQQSTRL